MGDAYNLNLVFGERFDLSKLIEFLKSNGHDIVFKENKEDNVLVWEVDYHTKNEFLIVYHKKIVSFMHMDGSQVDNPKLKKTFEKIYNFMKKEYPIKDASEWFGYEDPYQFILPYQTKKEQWELND